MIDQTLLERIDSVEHRASDAQAQVVQLAELLQPWAGFLERWGQRLRRIKALVGR